MERKPSGHRRARGSVVPLVLNAAVLIAAWLGLGCNDQIVDEAPCNPALAEIERVDGSKYLGCPDYDGEPVPWGQLPEFEGLPEDVETHEFTHCFDLAPGQACDGCSLDDTEQLMRDAYLEAKECDPAVVDEVGECSHTFRTDDGYYEECCTAVDCEQIIYEYSRGCAYTHEETGQCCYTALIASPCGGRYIY